MAGGLTRLEQAAMLPRPTRSTLVSKLSNDPSGRIGKLFNQVRPTPQDVVFSVDATGLSYRRVKLAGCELGTRFLLLVPPLPHLGIAPVPCEKLPTGIAATLGKICCEKGEKAAAHSASAAHVLTSSALKASRQC